MVTGISTNQDEYLNLFDKIILLKCSEKVVMDRLENRHKIPGENSFGKYSVERLYATTIQRDFEDKLLKIGAVTVNAENPINVVADEILSKI